MNNINTWHDTDCYVCFEEFCNDRPRVLSYHCRHAVCIDCWTTMTFKLPINKLHKCSYCGSSIFRDPRGVTSQYTIIETSAGDKLLANDLGPLCKDFIQAQLVLLSKN
jgi:DNA-directed RNA polymerase subunit RPC12/RpoP